MIPSSLVLCIPYHNALLHSGDAAALAAPGAYNPMLT